MFFAQMQKAPVLICISCHFVSFLPSSLTTYLLEKDTYCPPHVCQLHIALHEMSHLILTATYEITVTVSDLHLRKLRLIEIKCYYYQFPAYNI